MSIGSKIAYYRKRLNITQDALAQKLDVSNQAVSKWESDQCCPDIGLLPKLADIFETTIDDLFDRQSPARSALPWEDDDTLHIVVYHGHTLVGESKACNDLTFTYEGPALNIECAINITCDDVNGNVHAGGSVTCDCVEGSVHAGGNVTCDSVDGDVHAGGNVTCDCVDGNVQAGGSVSCDEIAGNATAKGNIYCDEINVEPVFGACHDQAEGHSKSGDVHIHREGNTVNAEKKGKFSFTFRKDK